MLLKSDDGKEFELALIADRLTEAQDGFGDDRAATVSFRVATEDVEWEETAEELNLHELRALREWLNAVADGAPDMAEIDLLQPELNFQVVRDMGERVRLRIHFHLEGRPEEFQTDAPTDEASHVDIELPKDALRIAATQLDADLGDLESPPKDDITAVEDIGPGVMHGDAQITLDQESPEPQGAGEGEDNAGEK
jgi:hypothetical protein